MHSRMHDWAVNRIFSSLKPDSEERHPATPLPLEDIVALTSKAQGDRYAA